MESKLIISERQADIGKFTVGRLLPVRNKRQVGPFTFIDHMGPAIIGNGKYLEVDQHPHTGLSTLTYLFKGEIEHKDSVGSVQRIGPGDVGFMTAGKGITHTERTPAYLRGTEEFEMHGYQIWIALPEDKEDIEPQFEYLPARDVPAWQTGSLAFKLIAGKAFGKSSPVQVFSDLFLVDILAEKTSALQLKGQISGEIGVIVVNGSIRDKDQTAESGQLLIGNSEILPEIIIEKDSHILLMGGKALKKEHYLLWNFVSHSKEKLRKAREDWVNKRFPKVDGDNSYVPFPRV